MLHVVRNTLCTCGKTLSIRIFAHVTDFEIYIFVEFKSIFNQISQMMIVCNTSALHALVFSDMAFYCRILLIFFVETNAAAAGIMFCQMQQLCSFTTVCCSFHGQPPPSLTVRTNQLQEMMNNMLVVSILPFLLQSFKNASLSHFEPLEKLHTPFLIFTPKNLGLN